MDKCHYYLSNGLWKIVRVYFDASKKEQNDYFWGMAVLPHYNSFGSHIISTPWQQSWATMDILESVHENLNEEEIKNEVLGASEIILLRKEVNFQYILKNYASHPFTQQLFTTYSRIQTHLLVNYSDAETKSFISKLKMLLKMLLNECPSNAHSLVLQLMKHGFFVNCLEAILYDEDDDTALYSLLFSGLCHSETMEIHLPIMVGLCQTAFRYQFCLLLLASDNTTLMQSVVDDDRKLIKCDTMTKLSTFLEQGINPLKIFNDMITIEKHFLFQILEFIRLHLNVFQSASHHNIPSYMWPLVLLQSWGDDSLPFNALPFLIDKCKELVKDRTILQIVFILEWYINFSVWYEKHRTGDSTIVDKKSDLLEKAKEHSVLYLINNSTDLSETDWNQILELLRQGKSRADVNSWDIILFNGYCILIHVINIILSSAEIYNLAKIQRTRLCDVATYNDLFSSLYLEEVAEKLKLVKNLFKSLYPLNFRLEILENIFSLIFIQYEDMAKLNLLSKVSDNILKSVIIKSKQTDRTGKHGKGLNLIHHQYVDQPEEEDLPKRIRYRGFICNKFIIRDLIYLVKECLGKLEEDFRSQSDETFSDVPCSINISQMGNRLDRLSESVNEATWRLQLVSDPDFVSQIGMMHHPCGQDPFHHFDNEWIFLPNELDKGALLKTKKKVAERTAESGSQSQSSTGNSGTETQSTKNKTSCRTIMNQMLASDSSLAIQCLAQGDVLNANHIIQMLGPENNKQTLEGELQFTESVNDLKRKLQNISSESPQKNILFGTDNGMAKSHSLQAIQIVANQGVISTALTNHIERFLSVSTLPSIQGASKVSVGGMLQCIENAQAIVTIDLALTLDMSFQDFKGLLNIASKYCPELSTRVQSPISCQTSFSKPLGYIVFSQNIIALLQEVNKTQISESDMEISLDRFLRSHQFPFSLKSLKDSIHFWKQLKTAVSDFEKYNCESSVITSNKEGSSNKQLRNIKEMQKVFETVKKLIDASNDFMDLGKTDNPVEVSKSINYMDLVSRYLNDLASFVLDNIPSKSDVTDSVTFRCLMEKSAVDIVDSLIFHFNVEPTVLEKKAQQLGFNLSASLVAGCCPRLPQNNILGESVTCHRAERIVLNELVSDYKSTEQLNPSEVVDTTFRELLIAFENYSKNKIVDNEVTEGTKNVLTEMDIIELRNDFKIQRILEKTLQLNFVDLKAVQKEDSLFFFINLLNLMMCHCYLSAKLDVTDSVYSNYFYNREVAYMFLGYNIGQLGFVSIFALKSLIYGEEFQSLFSARPSELSISNLVSDSRIVFAVNEFRSTSPKLQFYSTQLVDELQNIVIRYVENFVFLNDKHLVITDVLEWYLERILLPRWNKNSYGSNSNTKTEKIQVLVKFLLEHSKNELQRQLNEIITADIILEVQSPSPDLTLIIEYEKVNFNGKSIHIPTDLWSSRNLSDSILRHLNQSSRVLADIVQKIHEAKESAQPEVARRKTEEKTEEKLKYLNLVFSAPWYHPIVPLFENNSVITALSKFPEEKQLNDFFQQCISKKDWFSCLDVLFALPDYFVLSSLHLKRLKDIVLREITILLSHDHEKRPWYYSQHIGDINVRLETVKSCVNYWSGSVCISQLSSILCDFPNLSVALLEEIRGLIRKIRVYNTISETVPEFAGQSWFSVHNSANTSPHIVLQSLIKANQLELCLQWINLPGILISIQQYINSDFILLFFNNLSDDSELIDQLLNSLTPQTLSSVCDNVIYKLKSVPLISHLVQLLLRNNPLRKYEILAFGVKILYDLSFEEQSQLVHLISYPMLIIEQLLMNMRLDILENILTKVRGTEGVDLISQTEVNELIVSYARKAVEFDFIKAVQNADVKQSLLFESRPQIQQEFTVPIEVPDKSQWVPDNHVSVCMCCLLVTFSMFNRRHHCRRCGRVVCSACSPNQLKVPGYRGVPVRVCSSCFSHHTKIDSDSKGVSSVDSSSGYNFTQDSRYWKLSVDPIRNATIRDEFSFEYIPNVSLCLAIFNLIPDTKYLSILLDESEKMLKMLQLNGKSGNPEVDCGVVIQIIRSLIIGAKVKYGQACLTTGVACCDRLLSQVDLLNLLIKNHYSRLIPSEPLDGHTLRYLRDKLVEEELWDLAIEVSTKCGLDRKSVWASWGKACLAAGSWEEARTKFSYCLDSSIKPLKNSPLVDDICRILESSNSFISIKQSTKTGNMNTPAQEVTQILSSLKFLVHGKPLSFSANNVNSKNNTAYSEQIYYLSTYGSYQGLLSFYLKHDEWKLALTTFLELQLDSDLFVDTILMASFRNNKQNRLKAELLAIDSSLESFKKHLCHACHSLEKSDHLHILYEVQLFMQDFVRAAATNIRLYQRYSFTYKDLLSRSSFLHAAVRHLEEEMTCLNKKIKRLDCIMKLEPREINKHMNTIWRQLEVTKFLASCEDEGKFIHNLLPGFKSKDNELFTLFDGNSERITLASLVILSGKNITEGFGIAYRIIQDHHLDPSDIYITTCKILAESQRSSDIETLIDCMKTSGAGGVSGTIDQVLASCLPLAIQSGESSEVIERLVKFITNIDLKISMLIDAKQLKSAYLLAVRHNCLKAVQKIMEVADQTGQMMIKKICMKKLGQSPEGSICSSIPSVSDC